MKIFLTSSIICSILMITACSAQPSPEAAAVLENTIVPTHPPTTLPTETPTQTPLPTYSEDQLSAMSDEERLSHAPDKIANFTKSNVSETKNNIIVYRDADGIAQMVFDLTTAKELTLPEAGIVEMPLTTGEHWEVLYFETARKAIDYATLVDGAKGTTMDMHTHPDRAIFEPLIYKIVGFKMVKGIPVFDKKTSKAISGILVFETSDGTAILYIDRYDHMHVIYIDDNSQNVIRAAFNKDAEPLDTP
ncbi:MAG: hypothetical protein HZB18_04425 [Chloroflexi bacterium]|nr:hypothetical protein [Chloroflexota bacterium]